MELRKIKFRILLPIVYFALALLPLVGLILTIAEGPNPFGFLVFLSEPGFLLLSLLDPVLPDPAGVGLFTVLLGMLINVGIYFLVGYLIDYIIRRRHSA